MNVTKEAQCEANIVAILKYHGLPEILVTERECDRIEARVPVGFDLALNATRKFAMWNNVKNHNKPGRKAIRGWREEVARESLQVIEFDNETWGFDVDRFNPNFGLAPALGHLGELFRRGKTDPFAVAKGIKKRGIHVESVQAA